ncbi:ribonuclease III [Bacteroidales bacterium OttesenSCG-928-B11]|nr:ribonuclease III [Bacteroidales bacterium OttesenSCG-928-C03]MDL2312503.1 ribonuclease III [Bacteroidales bacterium OttesenSCG-928-B11]
MFLKRFLSGDNQGDQLRKYIRSLFGFTPQNIELYKIAFIHRSLSTKNKAGAVMNNERLEYLGDAVLSAVVADFLFKKYPFLAEGPLTEMRSKIVCRDRLNMLSKKIGLNKYISMEENAHAKSALGDAFEALVGAIYLDQGYNKTKRIIIRKILLTYLDLDSVIAEDTNFKSKVLSWAQKQHKQVRFVHSDCPDGARRKLFTAKLYIDNELYGEGVDYTIKKAEQMASEKTWEKIKD